MANQLQKLLFNVSLIDQVSRPAGKMRNSLLSVADTAKSAFLQIGIGAAGLVSAGYALNSLISPALNFQRSLGQVKSLDVTDQALTKLSNTALEFSSQYGKSASEFISSSYDIQSAIAGLTGDELSSFTHAGGILAAATKADTATITDYMGTMYGIFKTTAQNMGRAQWIEQLTGQTATAVKLFKTDGQKMSAAFANLGASATAMGRGVGEQLAVLGQLQATMSGSESATKYKAFLAGVGKAQSALGLKFTDSNGQMLGMVDILTKIKNKYGATIDVAEGDALKQAFGSKEAVQLIQLLLKDTSALTDNIHQLNNIKGMNAAKKMAAAMVDPWHKLSGSMNAVRIAMGQALLPVLNPLIAKLSEGAVALMRWSQEHPKLTKIIGLGVITILSLTAAFAALTVVVGLSKIAMAGFLIVKSVMVAVAALVPTLAALRSVMLAVNIVMIANPIGLIIVAIAALTAGVISIIYYWNDLKQAFLNTAFGQGLVTMINNIIKHFYKLKGMISSVLDFIISGLNKIPGVNIENNANVSSAPKALGLPHENLISSNSISKNISKAINNNQSRNNNIHIDKIITEQPAVPLYEELLMMGG